MVIEHGEALHRPEGSQGSNEQQCGCLSSWQVACSHEDLQQEEEGEPSRAAAPPAAA